MSAHNCPRIVRHYSVAYLGGYMDCVHPSVSCWICESAARAKYAAWMPHLAQLQAWLTDGEDLPYSLWGELHYYFSEYLGSDTLVDEWLCDRPEYIEDLVSDIQYFCIETVANPARARVEVS